MCIAYSVSNPYSGYRPQNTVKCLQSSMSVSKKPHKRRSAEGQLLSLARSQPVLRPRDVARQGIHTSTLTRMTRSGALERVGPGRYRLTKRTRVTEHHDLVVAAAAVPRSVVCLVSALRFHDIGTQLPAEVWIAVPRGTRMPHLAEPPIRVVNVAPAVFDVGVEEHRVEGHIIRVYSIARTVADCFRFRNKNRSRRGAGSANGGVAQQTPQAGRTESNWKEASRPARDAAVSRHGRPVKRSGPKNIVASVQARLVERSRELGVEHQLTLARFGGERLLYRLSNSEFADRFILKGAALLLVWLGEPIRPTKTSICSALVTHPPTR